MDNFETTQEAVEFLMDDVPPECGEKMVEHFWQAYDEGLDITTCVRKAVLMHEHVDHGAGIPEGFPFKTDDEMIGAILGAISEDVPEARREEAERVILDQYWMLRDWGINIPRAGENAVRWSEKILEERWPMSVEEALQTFDKKISSPALAQRAKDLLLQVLEHEPEMPVRDAARMVIKIINAAIKITGALGDLFE